jgi:hypothetical protein
VRALLVAVVASLALAAPSSAAFTPPELFVRLQRADITHQPASDWIPLASAPLFNYIGGYQIGYRLQPSGLGSGPGNFQTVALTITGVPDGQPTQPSLATPYCVGRNGTAGTIVPVDEIEMQYEGNGTYSVSVSVGGDPPGTGCVGGPTTTGSFRVDTHVTPQLVGQPFAFRAEPLPGDPFVGIRAGDPPGGFADNVCALDATVAPDGSVTGRRVIPEDSEPPRQTVSTFPEPGNWTCVGRGVVEGQDLDYERTFFGTPWSAPLAVPVLSDFQRVQTRITRARKSRPQLDVTPQFPVSSAGGRATLKLRRLIRCKRRGGYVFKTIGTYRSAFGANGHAKFRVKRPRKVAFYAGVLTFGGTRFVRPGADPAWMLLGATKRSIRFVNPQAYPRC